MHAADPLQPGSVLAGRYRLGPLLGSGGMAFVHRATDEVLGREVALKALVRASTDPTELQRIRSEIDLLATLSHRSLVTLFDAGTTDVDGSTVTYLVMELVDGPALDARLSLGPLAEPEVARMARDLAESLVVVHARGIVHRDLKPANVLLAPSPLPGREFDAKLADFGIAAIVDAARLTATGTVLGTAAYLSPEQATGQRVGPPSDIYSLGLVLLETLTGRREFPGTPLESLGARLTRDPDVPGSVGYEWKSLLTAMTARDPDARPTAAAVLERLGERSGRTPLVVGGAGAAATAEMTPAAAATAATAVLAAATVPADPARTTADTAPAPAAEPLPVSGAARRETAARPLRGRRWALAGGAATAVAILGAVAAFSLQGTANQPTVSPKVIESQVPAADPTPAPVPAPAETTAPPAAPAPAVEAPAAGEPAVEAPVTDPGTGTENAGTENAGSGDGGGNGGNNGGNNGNGNGNGGGNGGNNGNGNGSGGGGNGNGGNGGGNGNGNRP